MSSDRAQPTGEPSVASAEQGGAPTAPPLRRGALTVGLVMTVLMAGFESLAVATILPQTARELHGMDYYGWAFSGFMLSNLLGIPLAGRAADRRGPGRPFAVGVVLFVGGLLCAGLARSMLPFVLGRVLQGGGAAALQAVSYVAVARAFPVADQPRLLALLSSAWVVPGLFGPAAAALVARMFGWRAVFLGLLIPSMLAGGLALLGLRGLAPAAAPTTTTTTNEPRAVALPSGLLAIGAALLLLGARSPGAPLVVGLMTVGALLTGAGLQRLLPEGTLRAAAGLPAAIAVLALIQFAFFSAEAFLPLALSQVRGQDSGSAGAAALTAGTLLWTAGSWLQARISGHRRALLLGGIGGLLVGVLGSAAVLSPLVWPWLALVSWSVAGFGMGIAFQVGTLAVLAAAPPGREGHSTSINQVASALAIALGTGLGGEAITRLAAGGYGTAVGIAAVDGAAVLCCLLALRAARGVA